MSVTIRKRALRSGKTSLYLDVYEDGHRRQEMLKLYLVGDRHTDAKIMSLAEAVRAKRVIELQNGAYGFTPEHRRRTRFLDFYDELARSRDVNWKTARKHVAAFSGANVRLDRADERWLERLQNFLLTRVSPNTARTHASKVRAALNEAYRRRLIPSSPASRVPNLKGIETETVFLEHEELIAMAAADCRNEVVKRAFLFSCCTGLRISDVRALRWRHLQGRRLLYRQKKTKAAQYTGLSDQALVLMGERGVADETVFPLPKAQSSVNDILREWATNAGVTKRISYHVSRHTCATLLITEGNDIYTTSHILGHRDLSSTQRYAKVVDLRREKAIASIPWFAVQPKPDHII